MTETQGEDRAALAARRLEFEKLEASAYLTLPNEVQRGSQLYGSLTIRMLVLVNGAAAVAVLTLMSNVAGHSVESNARLLAALASAPLWFAWGVLAAIFAAALGYINFQANLAVLPSPWQVTRGLANDRNPMWPKSRAQHLIGPTAWLAVASCFVSATLFLVGAYGAASAFSHALQ